uniref:Striatin interacting protein 2 n=1 Tax=Sus scrofa TaxID=9823 RepID=A0A4X1VYN6_PIG
MLQDWAKRGGTNPLNEPPPPPSRARSGVTANQTEGRGCEEGPQPIAVEGAGPGSRRAAAAGSPRAESGQRLRGAADKSCMEDPAAPGAGSPPANGNGVGNGSGKGKPVAPKGREAFRSQRRESEGSVDCPTLEFEYGDADGHAAELSELYSYTENPEFTTNRRCFEEDFKTQVQGKEWLELEEDAQKAYVMGLLDRLEVVSRERRLKVARAVLYLAQGTFGECDSEVDVLHWSRYNCFLLYQMGTFSTFLELLHMEIDNSQACSSALRKPAISIADSTELRVLLSVMYLMVENIRLERETDSCGWRTARETFRTELSFSMHNEEPFALLLFSMVTKFCSGLAPHFPIKKVLLLLWKVVMQLLTKQDSLDIYNERDLFKTEEPAAEEEEESAGDGERTLDGELDLLEQDPLVPPPPSQAPLSAERVTFPKGLPWAPKVRQKDIEHFLEMSRNKFIGFTLGQDTDTLVGLPRPIHESVKTLKQHKYISIADVQIKNEEELEKCPMSLGEEVVPETPCEILYQGMLYSLPQYMIALLKILLAAAPTSKAKTDSINILADVLPEEMPITVLQSMKLGIDVNRHKEIIVKSISALLLLLLKHFKLNHIYQFEYVSQHLVFANCIPLILKFFNQNILSYITAKNSISVLDYPCCTIQDLPELTTESLEAGDNNQFCWRNLFSCINLLRLLNKLTKWKHSRTMMLVVFKSAPILKRALKVKQAMLQLYVLKLLKIQTKYLGRQWRKSNMKTMSAIYQKVRHRMNDDWAYGNDIDARPWDFQAEECTLRANIEAFNSRRKENNQSLSKELQEYKSRPTSAQTPLVTVTFSLNKIMPSVPLPPNGSITLNIL